MPINPTPDTLLKLIHQLQRRLDDLENANLVAGGSSSGGAVSGASLSITGAAVVGTLQVGASGTALSQATVYNPTLTPTAVGGNSTSEQTFTVTGLATSDKVLVNGPAPTAGVALVHARVSAGNTLALTFANVTAGSLTPASGTYLVLAIRS